MKIQHHGDGVMLSMYVALVAGEWRWRRETYRHSSGREKAHEGGKRKEGEERAAVKAQHQ